MIAQLKRWSKALPYPLFLRLFYLVYGTREVRTAKRVLRRTGIPLLQREALLACKKSDVLFVLGSGPSINQITADRWQAIARHDSLALNFWVLHPFVPSFYLFESIEQSEFPRAAQIMLEAFARRAEDYRETVKVAMEVHRHGRQMAEELPAAFRENLYAALSLPAPARTERELEYALRYLANAGVFDTDRNYSRLLKYAASITTALTVAAKLRYKSVVFCGVDLRDQRYFFQDRDLFPDTADLSFLPRAEPHDTNVALEWRLPSEQVIQMLKRVVLDPAGIELYVENLNSALYPAVPEASAAVFSPV